MYNISIGSFYFPILNKKLIRGGNMNCPYVMRVCKECGEVKFLFKFIKNKKSKYGFEKKCKQCQSEYQAKYYKGHKEEKVEYQKKHKEKIMKYKKEYNRERKEEIVEHNKRYYKEHKEEITERNKKYYEGHKEEILVYKKKYLRENREEILEYQKKYKQTPRGQVIRFNSHNKRRSKEKSQGNGITTKQWKEMMDFFDWKCAYSDIYIGSKNQNGRSIDHITALDNGGLNEIWNCVPMYKPYNSSKNTSDMLEWYRQQDFYSEERLQKIYEWQEYAYNKWGKEGEVCLH